MYQPSLAQTVPAGKVSGDGRRIPMFKLIRLLLELSRASLILWLQFPRLERDRKLLEIQRWASKILLILQVEIQCEGSLPDQSNALVVANHVSWLDILVIQSLMPGVFVAKAEVRRWPLFGMLAQACSTIFVERSSRASARTMVDGALRAFEQGYSVVAFPEGTSSDGVDLAAFHSNVFECAIKAQTPVRPVTLRYVEGQTGLPCEAALFIGEMTLTSSLRRVMATSTIKTLVHIGDCIHVAGQTRKSLSVQAHRHIRSQLDLLQ
ncbi:MAG: lysophospholipid acyltransferase family protein [Rhodoferax sp.]